MMAADALDQLIDFIERDRPRLSFRTLDALHDFARGTAANEFGLVRDCYLERVDFSEDGAEIVLTVPTWRSIAAARWSDPLSDRIRQRLRAREARR